jgi:hypothetical protein
MTSYERAAFNATNNIRQTIIDAMPPSYKKLQSQWGTILSKKEARTLGTAMFREGDVEDIRNIVDEIGEGINYNEFRAGFLNAAKKAAKQKRGGALALFETPEFSEKVQAVLGVDASITRQQMQELLEDNAFYSLMKEATKNRGTDELQTPPDYSKILSEAFDFGQAVVPRVGTQSIASRATGLRYGIRSRLGRATEGNAARNELLLELLLAEGPEQARRQAERIVSLANMKPKTNVTRDILATTPARNTLLGMLADEEEY